LRRDQAAARSRSSSRRGRHASHQRAGGGDALLDVAGRSTADHIEKGRGLLHRGGIGTAVVYPIACGVKALVGTWSPSSAADAGLVILEKELRDVSER